MSNIPISSLPLALSLDGSESVPLVQGGTTKRIAAELFFGIPLPLIGIPSPSTDYTVPVRQVSTGLPFATTISEFMTALHGVPGGGTTGQILGKLSDTDYDTGWVSAGTVFSVGLAMPSIFTVTGSPVTSSGTLTATLNNENANTVFAGPGSGAGATPTFRSLVGDDLPDPSPTTLGGIKSIAVVTHQFLTGIGTDGSVSQAQPTFPDISGTLGVDQGGTGLTSGTSGGILGFTDSGTLASSAALTANALVLGGGAGATPVPLGSLGTTTTVLHGNASGAPTFGAVSLTADVSGILPGANGGTGVANTGKTITLGGNLTTSGSFASTFTMTGATSVTFPTSGTLATTGGASIPSVAQGDLLYGSAPNVLSALAKSATATRYLANTGTSNNPAWDQVNLTNGVTGTLPVGNGGTGIVNPTAHDLLIGNGSSAMTQLAPSATSGIPLVSQGSSSDPAYSTAVVAGGGTGLASLTAHNLLIGNGASAATLLPPSATVGVPLVSAGASADPAYGTATVPGGGTGLTSATAYAVLCGGTTSTGALQSVASVGTAGQILTSAGSGALPVMAGITTALDAVSSTQGSILYRGSGGWVALPPSTTGRVLTTNGIGLDPSWSAVSGTGTVTSISPGSGLTSTLIATAPGSAITTSGSLAAAELVNAQTGTSYAIQDSDRAKLVTASNSSAQAYSIAQAGAASAFQAGWFTDIKNISATGDVTVTPSSSTINGASSLVISPGQSARITSDGTNYQVVFNGPPRPKVTTFTFDASLATNFSVTGVGFQPRSAIFIATVITSQNVVSWGMTDGTTTADLVARGTAASIPNYTLQGTVMNLITNGTANQNEIALVSLDSDGATFSRSKTGSPSGTVTVMAMWFP